MNFSSFTTSDKAIYSASVVDSATLFIPLLLQATPQQNAYVERVFPTIMGQARAMTNFAGFTTKKCKQLRCEVANTVTMLDNMLFHEQDIAPLHKMSYDKDAKSAKHL